MSSERGEFRFGPVVGIVLIALALVGLFTLCGDGDDDEIDGHVPIQLVDHEYDDGYYEDEGDDYRGEYDYNYGGDDRNRNRGRNRGAFSPGPFDDSPVDFRDNCISLDCGGRERRDEEMR